MAQLKDLLVLTDNNSFLLSCITADKPKHILTPVSHYLDEYGEYVQVYYNETTGEYEDVHL